MARESKESSILVDSNKKTTEYRNLHSVDEANEEHDMKTKLYKRRWYVLGLYVLYIMCNSSQWLQYAIIENVVRKYYGITMWHVNLTSLVMMGCYLPLALPVANLMDKISLRWTAIIGSLGTAIGSFIKLFSANPNGFHITLVGQTVVAVAQVLMLSVPQKLSSIWFGEREVSLACSIGVFGFQFGLVVGFFLPPILVSNQETTEQIGQDLYRMYLCYAIASCVTAALVIFTFQAEPLIPPTLSQARSRLRGPSSETGYIKILKRLFLNRKYTAFYITTGINNGCFNGLSTLLSQIFLRYFPNCEQDAGNIGVTMIVFGMFASVIYGLILDRTKKFKFLLIFIYFMSAIAMAAFTIVIVYAKKVWMIYIAAAFVGAFLCGFTAVSFDVATEITYPESEVIVGTIMNMMSLLFTLAATIIFGYVNESYGYLWGNIGFILVLFAGAICMLPIKFENKRTTAQSLKFNERNRLMCKV